MEALMICGKEWFMGLRRWQKRRWENLVVLDLGVKNLGGGMTTFRVKLGSKEIVLKIGLGVKMLKLGINIRKLERG